MIRDTENGNTG